MPGSRDGTRASDQGLVLSRALAGAELVGELSPGRLSARPQDGRDHEHASRGARPEQVLESVRSRQALKQWYARRVDEHAAAGIGARQAVDSVVLVWQALIESGAPDGHHYAAGGDRSAAVGSARCSLQQPPACAESAAPGSVRYPEPPASADAFGQRGTGYSARIAK